MADLKAQLNDVAGEAIVTDVAKEADMGRQAAGTWKVRTAVRQSDGTMAILEFATAMDAPPSKAADVVPPETLRRLSYFDDEETRRVARQLPRFIQQQQQQQSPSAAGNERLGAPGAMAPLTQQPPPSLSGKACAREEIFLRRAQMVSELSNLGLPVMSDWSVPGGGLFSHSNSIQGKCHTHFLNL